MASYTSKYAEPVRVFLEHMLGTYEPELGVWLYERGNGKTYLMRLLDDGRIGDGEEVDPASAPAVAAQPTLTLPRKYVQELVDALAAAGITPTERKNDDLFQSVVAHRDDLRTLAFALANRDEAA